MSHYILNTENRVVMRRFAEYLGYGIIIIAIIQGIMTAVIPVGPASNPPEVYTRNISSIVCLFLLGYFFVLWSRINGGDAHSQKKTDMFKFITLLMSAASLVKTAISGYFVLNYMSIGNKIFYYYLGEVIVWCCCTVFFVSYFYRLRRKK